MTPPADAAPASPGGEQFELDPVFLNSRREAIAIFSVWFVCLLWAVPVCYTMGYGHDVVPGEVPTVMGIPSWVFWGLMIPWLLADVATTWLCFRFIKDDDLGQAEDERTADATNPNAAGGEGSA
jgi:hypothetical protein